MDSGDRWLVGWALGYAAIGAASLLVPLYALELGGGPFLVGLIASVAAFVGVPGALVWGKLAERTERRRPFVLVALATTAATLGVMPLITAPWPLLVANSALWFFVAAAAPVLNLIMVEGYPENAWSTRIGLLNAYQGYGWLAGMLGGTVWTALLSRFVPMATRVFFAVLAVTALAGLLLVRGWYPERPTVSMDRFERVYRRLDRTAWGAGRYLRSIPYGPTRLLWGLRTLRADRVRERFTSPLWRYLLAATLFSTGFAVFWGPAPAYLIKQGYTSATIFVFFLLANVGSAACYAPVGTLSAKRDPRTLQLGALLARVGLFPGVALVGTLFLGVGGAFVGLGVTWAVIAVTAASLVTLLAPADARGEALGIYTAIVGVGTGIGSVIGGWVALVAGYLAAFGLAGALVLGASLLVLVVPKHVTTTEPEA